MEVWQESASSTAVLRDPSDVDYIKALVAEAVEPFCAQVSKDKANTEHWAKVAIQVAGESKRASAQIASGLQQGSGHVTPETQSCTAPQVEALAEALRSEWQADLKRELGRSREDIQASMKNLYREFERIVSQAVSTATSEARTAAREEAAAALDKVLEVEGKTLEQWTSEFDLKRSELSRHAGHLASLEEQLAKRAARLEEELPQLAQLSGLATGAVSQETSAIVEDGLADMDGTPTFTTRDFCEDSECSMEVRSPELKTGEVLRVLLDRIVRVEGVLNGKREANSQDDELKRVESLCVSQLSAMEFSLAELSGKFKEHDEELKSLRQLADVERAERDERQQAFSETIHRTLQMLISKMDSLGSASARGAKSDQPPAPLPMRSRALEVSVAGPPAPFLGKALGVSLRRGAGGVPLAGRTSTISGASSAPTRSPSEAVFSSPSECSTAKHSFQPPPAPADVVFEGLASNASSEAVRALGIPEDEPVVWTPKLTGASVTERARSLSPICFTSRAVCSPVEESLSQASVLRRVISLSPGRSCRTGPALLPQASMAPLLGATFLGSSRCPVPSMPAAAAAASTRPMHASPMPLLSPVLTSRMRSPSPTMCRAVSPCRTVSPPMPSRLALSISAAPATIAVVTASAGEAGHEASTASWHVPNSPHLSEGRHGSARFAACSYVASAAAPPSGSYTVTSSPGRTQRSSLSPSVFRSPHT